MQCHVLCWRVTALDSRTLIIGGRNMKPELIISLINSQVVWLLCVLVLRKAEYYCNHLRSLKSFADYDLKMGNCWLRPTSWKINCFHSLSFLPEVSLQNFSAESSFCLYLILNKTRIHLPQSEFRDVVTAGHCCPELLQLFLISFFRLFGRFCQCFLTSLTCHWCSLVCLFFHVRREEIFSISIIKCAQGGVCVLLIPPSEIKFMLNYIGRTFLTHWLCTSASSCARDFGVTQLMNKHKLENCRRFSVVKRVKKMATPKYRTFQTDS